MGIKRWHEGKINTFAHFNQLLMEIKTDSEKEDPEDWEEDMDQNTPSKQKVQ